MTPRAAHPATTTRHRVLIVDDEEELVSALVERLELRGVPVTGVTSGQQALTVIEDHDFDLVLIDLKMPGLDGLEVIRAMRHLRPGLRFVLLTGHGAKENEEAARRAGAMECLLKPVKIERLLEIIQQVGVTPRSPNVP